MFEDDTGQGKVCFVIQKLRNFSPGAHSPRVVVHFDAEPLARMAQAISAGWTELESSL